MKKQLFVVAFAAFLLSACSDKEEPLSEVTVNSAQESGLIAYPMRDGHKGMTKSMPIVSNWENWERITLGTGASVIVPWVEPTTSDIPKDIRTDIKPTDGWDLIAHTVNGYGEPGLNYLIFHNKFTGILKVFYYLETSAAQLQNTAMWKIHFESPQSFLAFTNEYAEDATKRNQSDIYVGNITNNSSKGYSVGWNCFQVELAYDPNFTTGSLQFIPESMTTTDITLEGTTESETNGLIISVTNSNPLDGAVSGTASKGGEAAEKWVVKQVSNGAFKKVSSLIGEGVKGIVKAGINKLLGSFIGGFSSTSETTKQVQLKTKGTVKLQGKISSLQSGMVSPLSFSISKKDVGTLGAWGVPAKPSVYLHPLATYEDTNNSYDFTYMYTPEGLEGNDMKAVINPDLLPYITNYNFEYDVYQASNVKIDRALGTSMGSAFEYSLNPDYNLYEKIYSISPLTIPIMYKNLTGATLPPYDTPAPYTVYLPDAPLGGSSSGKKFDLTSHFIIVATLTLNTDIQGAKNTIVSSHTFIPNVKWHPSLLASTKGKYYPHVNK